MEFIQKIFIKQLKIVNLAQNLIFFRISTKNDKNHVFR